MTDSHYSNDAQASLLSLDDIEDYLYALPAQQKDPTARLKYVKTVLKKLGDPQNCMPAIHIAGTSGKGSTAYYASSLLVGAGYTVGLMVSPHVHSVKERAQINGKPLSDNEYIAHFNQFLGVVAGTKLSYIEFLTIFAYWLFAKVPVDYAVIEVGLGGLLDPTNVISRPQTVRVITDIGYDHVELLGSTLAEITSQKAGIIHNADIVVMNQQAPEITDVIKQTAEKSQAALTEARQSKQPAILRLPLFQRRNWSLAYEAVAQRLAIDGRVPLSEQAVRTSLEAVVPGRFEKVLYNDTLFVLDAAHNPQKMTALVASLSQDQPDKKPVFVVAFGENKRSSAGESLALLTPIASKCITTQFHLDFSAGHGAIPAKELANMAGPACIVEPSLQKALLKAVELAAQQNTYVVVTGSFYLLDNVYPLLAMGQQRNE